MAETLPAVSPINVPLGARMTSLAIAPSPVGTADQAVILFTQQLAQYFSGAIPVDGLSQDDLMKTGDDALILNLLRALVSQDATAVTAGLNSSENRRLKGFFHNLGFTHFIGLDFKKVAEFIKNFVISKAAFEHAA